VASNLDFGLPRIVEGRVGVCCELLINISNINMIERCLVLWKEMQLKRLFKTQRWELKNMIVCRKHNGKVKVMGWSGETSVHVFFVVFFVVCFCYK